MFKKYRGVEGLTAPPQIHEIRTSRVGSGTVNFQTFVSKFTYSKILSFLGIVL